MTEQPDREQFKRLVTEAAFTDPDSGRVTVHSLLGPLGADWDLDDVLTLIDNAREVSWDPHPGVASHELRVITTDHSLDSVMHQLGLTPTELVYWFDVRAPQPTEPATQNSPNQDITRTDTDR